MYYFFRTLRHISACLSKACPPNVWAYSGRCPRSNGKPCLLPEKRLLDLWRKCRFFSCPLRSRNRTPTKPYYTIWHKQSCPKFNVYVRLYILLLTIVAYAFVVDKHLYTHQKMNQILMRNLYWTSSNPVGTWSANSLKVQHSNSLHRDTTQFWSVKGTVSVQCFLLKTSRLSMYWSKRSLNWKKSKTNLVFISKRIQNENCRV